MAQLDGELALEWGMLYLYEALSRSRGGALQVHVGDARGSPPAREAAREGAASACTAVGVAQASPSRAVGETDGAMPAAAGAVSTVNGDPVALGPVLWAHEATFLMARTVGEPGILVVVLASSEWYAYGAGAAEAWSRDSS